MATKKLSFAEQPVADISTAIGKLATVMGDVYCLANDAVMSDVGRKEIAAFALANLQEVEGALDRIALRDVQTKATEASHG